MEIADAIHQEIRQEIYKQGDKLPVRRGTVERELQEWYACCVCNASRMTILGVAKAGAAGSGTH